MRSTIRKNHKTENNIRTFCKEQADQTRNKKKRGSYGKEGCMYAEGECCNSGI